MTDDRLPARWVEQPRNGHGRWSRDQTTAERDAAIADDLDRGLTQRTVAQRWGMTHQAVAQAYDRATRDRTMRSEQHRNRQIGRSGHLRELLVEIAEAEHVAHAHGRVVWITDDDGRKIAPVRDPGPRITAINSMIRLEDLEARLVGTYAPSRQRVSVITDEDLADLVAAEEAAADAAEADLAHLTDDEAPARNHPVNDDSPPP